MYIFSKVLHILQSHAIDLTVIDPTEGPCAVNNGGCDHICTAESKVVKCYCRLGYFSIAFLPMKCFGKYSYTSHT